MADRPMNRDELERLGALLFGFAWKSRLADVLDINRKTVSRWIADDAVAQWAADRLRAMAHIAPPPGTTDADDRDDACADAVEGDLSRLVLLATDAGWHRAEVMTAILSLTITDMVTHAGPGTTVDLLRQAVAQIEQVENHRSEGG